MKTPGTRKPPRRPTGGYICTKRGKTIEEPEEDPPPDPKASSDDFNVHCLLRDIDDKKLVLLMIGHPSSRSTALILQALRQQMSVATLDEYVADALKWVVDNDVLMLKMKKNSLFCRVLQADGVDSREQMARFVNTIASYPNGRHYLAAHQKVFLPCLVAILRGKRIPSTTHDQLIACIQKMSTRNSCQKELLQSGVLEWAVNHFDQKLSNYAFEYLAALVINLSSNSLSHQIVARLADSIANSIAGLILKVSHGTSCSLYNNLIMSALSCSRIRLRSKDTKLLEAIRTRLEMRPNCPLCSLHNPYLQAIINQDVEFNRVPQSPTESDADKAGISCEREIDALDPLRPSSNELSGARLLIRKAYCDHSNEFQQTPVPGQVPYKSSSHPQLSSRANSKASNRKSEPPPQQQHQKRIGTATSQHTFVIETERRRPLVVNIGLTEGALEYKKMTDERARKLEDEERKKRKEKEEKEKEKQKALRHIQLTSRKAPSLLKKELSMAANLEPEKIISTHNQIKKSFSKNSITKKGNHSEEKNNNNKEPSNDPEYPIENETFDDYNAVFGSRPKRYLFLIFFSFLFTITSVILTSNFSAKIEAKLVEIMLHNYVNYMSNEKSRKIMDQIHVKYSCCGIHGIKDFLDFTEVEGFEKYFDESVRPPACTEWDYCNLPMTCCHSTMCSKAFRIFRAPVDQEEIIEKWFHNKGCLWEIRDNITLLPSDYIVTIILVLTLLLKVISLFLVKLVMTSYATLKMTNSADEEDSFAWIMEYGYPEPKDIIDVFHEEEDSTSDQNVEKLKKIEDVEVEEKLELEVPSVSKPELSSSSNPTPATRISSTETKKSSENPTPATKISSTETKKTSENPTPPVETTKTSKVASDEGANESDEPEKSNESKESTTKSKENKGKKAKKGGTKKAKKKAKKGKSKEKNNKKKKANAKKKKTKKKASKTTAKAKAKPKQTAKPKPKPKRAKK
ncbi:unnamed protein product [Caenorhabditis bovis]|uniref:LisH domain-containing protein n=1 Tax=Caenorhabditis bovis TaxID=2654633 RepID=A0A8S1ETV1_9PELO|nr:unnamed protein product [Caenorhabditis bovis]